MTAMTSTVSSYITLTTAAEHTGLSVASLRRAIRARRLRAHRPTRRVLIAPADLDAFVLGTTKADKKEA